jgi:Na+/melibiose symporter-like transporter
MKSCYCLVPAVLFLVALVAFWGYPISRGYAAKVRAELDERKRAAAAAEEARG